MITLITPDGTMTRVGREELQIENEVTLIEILDRLKNFNRDFLFISKTEKRKPIKLSLYSVGHCFTNRQERFSALNMDILEFLPLWISFCQEGLDKVSTGGKIRIK